MGFNSVVFVCNDAIGSIEKDPKGWWQRTWEALCRIPGHALSKEEAKEWIAKRGESTYRSFSALQGEYGFGNNANGYQAVWNQHADVTGLIAVGGNFATVLLQEHGVNHYDHEGQVKLLKALANKLGYRIVKKPETKKTNV